MCLRDMLRIRWNLVFIGEEWSRGSLFVGTERGLGDFENQFPPKGLKLMEAIGRRSGGFSKENGE